MIEKNWAKLEANIPLDDFLRELLWKRGYQTSEALEAFVNPSLKNIPVPSGNLLDLEEALSLLVRAHDQKHPVVIFGDYDVDGTTSTALLVLALRDWGFQVSPYIPHRIREGYGLTKKAAANLLERFPDAKLVVTCDCGIASFEGIEWLRSRDINVIVTDHHEVPEARVHANAVLNPKQAECPYPEKRLAGVGVAFLLVIALRKALGLGEYSLARFLELVAIGTVCDVAELKGANRVFTKLGLKRLQQSSFPGLRVLLQYQNLDGSKITARDLGFVVGPRLNASGRIGEPDLGLRLLLAQSESEAIPLVIEMENKNRERRAMQDEQVEKSIQLARSRLEKNPTNNAIILGDQEFHLGIVGLIAGRLVTQFQRPACVLTELVDEHALADYGTSEGLWKGSLRAPLGFHLAEILNRIKLAEPDLLVSAGGHALAAGIALKEANLKKFEKLFEEELKSFSKTELDSPFEMELTSTDLSLESLRTLEPFGQGNPKPSCLLRGLRFQSIQIMKEIHIRLLGTFGGQAFSCVQFRSPHISLLKSVTNAFNLELDLLVEPMENNFRGKERVEWELKEILGVRSNGRALEIKRESNAIGASAST